MKKNFYGLWYRRPAAAWVEALPLGNGKLGAMIPGGIQHETIMLNEETVWDGFQRDRTNPKAYESLLKVRQAIFQEDYKSAEKWGMGMLGVPTGLDSYQPLADLEMRVYHTGSFRNYRRGLDLNQGLVQVEYDLETKGHYSREAFASAKDQMVVMEWKTDDPEGLNLDISMNRMNPVKVCVGQAELLLTGQCREGGVKFAALLRVRIEGGICTGDGNMLRVRKAGRLEIRIGAATDFHNESETDKCREILDAAESKTYVELLERHLEDYEALYQRQHFALGNDDELSAADELLKSFRRGEKKQSLYVLMYNYLRYLIISSSRPGSMPSTLQGIWNDSMNAPWNSDFHPNVNLEINYWPVESYGLPECAEPLADWLWSLIPSGTKTAREHYHADGWVLHHISDIFGCTTPMDGLWGLWPFGGSWLCRQVYDHYLYTGDKKFLKERALPLIEGSVRFMLDFLVECPKGKVGEGCLVTCPSHSPENRFIDRHGKEAWITYGSAMDMELIWDLFTIYLEALGEAGISTPLEKRVREARDRLPPIQISKKTGCIQEWIEDYEEVEPGHRHVSHLFALYPGKQITQKEPKLYEAGRKSLERRLSHNYDGQGWGYGWAANLFARLKDGDRSLEMLDKIIGSSLLDNFFIQGHGIPQVGDAQAFAAAIQEMLIQSDGENVELLPALPKSWKEGYMEGIRVRGGIIFNLYWSDGKLTKAKFWTCRDRKLLIGAGLDQIRKPDGSLAARKNETGWFRVYARADTNYILTGGEMERK